MVTQQRRVVNRSLCNSLLVGVSLLLSCGAVTADGLTGLAAMKRTELHRTPLVGEPTNMMIVVSTMEVAPNDTIPYHVHHGVETSYLLEDCLVLPAGSPKPVELKAGTSVLNLRDVPHGGAKVLGPHPFRAVTIHVVDKDKPINDVVRNSASNS